MAKSTFFATFFGIFWLNICMSRYTKFIVKDQRAPDYNDDDNWLKSAKLKHSDDEFITFLREEDRVAGMVNIRKVRQKLYACSQIWKHIPENFKKQWLLEDATSAIASLGFSGRQGENMVAVENTDKIHNLVVCTLCSCYPIPVLGLPPVWYKSAPYRSRAVIEPRAVLEEFGLNLPKDVQVRVWDSTAELRYLVIPLQPDGTKDMPEEKLVELVNRDSMIGTGLPFNAAELGNE